MSKSALKLKLNLKAICLFEALRDKSYQEIQLDDEEDISALLYAMNVGGGGYVCTLREMRATFKAKTVVASIRKEFERAMELAEQVRISYAEDHKPTEDKEEQKPSRVSDIAHMIIANGVDARYVMYDMEVWEMPQMVRAIENKKRDDAELLRLMTYYTIMPHIDSSKASKIKDVVPLPWEMAQIEAERAAEMKADIDIAEAIENTFFKPNNPWPED